MKIAISKEWLLKRAHIEESESPFMCVALRMSKCRHHWMKAEPVNYPTLTHVCSKCGLFQRKK